MQSLWTIQNKNVAHWLLLVSGILYAIFAYALDRTSYTALLGIYTILFYFFWLIVSSDQVAERSLLQWSFALRALFILALPNLSQDFYRFIWDGRMLWQQFNPYLYTPDSFIQNGTYPIPQAQQLYDGMGALSSSHFTNYPPLNQLCFWLSALFAHKSIVGSVVVMRVLIVAADYGVYHFGKKLLYSLGIPTKRIFWYLLNPFVIIELTGNLHFEGVMAFFLVTSVYFLSMRKNSLSAVFFALSVSIKLIPLMFLPLLYKRLGFYKLALYSLIVLSITAFGFVPFLSSQFYTNYANTVGLWFQNFEFNASVYYLIRDAAYLARGYNEIAIIGKILPLVVVIFIAVVSLYRADTSVSSLIYKMVLVLGLYLFLSTTVHPWYIITLLCLSIFTTYKFPLVWSFVVFLSYAAYLHSAYTENLYIVALEYTVVYAALIYDLYIRRRTSTDCESLNVTK